MASANAEKDALEIIREHYADICKQISDPLSLAQDLYQAKVISESCLSEVETDGLVNSKRITIIMKHVRTVVRSSGAKLKDFAVVLQRYPETEAKGVKLLLTCSTLIYNRAYITQHTPLSSTINYCSLGWFSNDHYSISVFYTRVEHTNTIMVIIEPA